MSRMQQVLNGFTKIDDDLFDELEETMITSDLGPETSVEICETLAQACERAWRKGSPGDHGA